MIQVLAGNNACKSWRKKLKLISKLYSHSQEATFEVKPFKLYKLEKGPSDNVSIQAKEALWLYEKLVLLRRMETAAGNMYNAQLIRGFCHLYIGEEAVAVGIKSVMRDVDTVITSYRCHAWTQIMGASVREVLGELSGRKSGVSSGKGGSMHMYTKNFYGGNGIVGASVPLGAGLAFAHKYRETGGVSFTLYGDGASNQGQIFETMNIAKLWNLPVVFICENNIYGMGTCVERSSASTEFYKRGDFIPGVWVDGMDVLATREAALFALDHCTSGKGPLVLEMETYRYVGHSMSDPGTCYRTREEIQRIRSTRDPITTFKERILSKKLVTDDQLKEIETKIQDEIQEDVEFVKKEPEAKADYLSFDIYFENLHEFIRGVRPDAPLTHSVTSRSQK